MSATDSPGVDFEQVSIGPVSVEIPTDWDLVSLEDVSENSGEYGANASAEPFDPDEFRYIRITDLTEDGRLKDSGKQSIPIEGNEKYQLEKGDLLFARTGAVGRTYLYSESDSEVPCAFAGYLIRFKLSSSIDHDYLRHYTNSEYFGKWVDSVARSTTHANINASEFSSVDIPRPPLPEQRRIADVLSKVDERIQQTDEIIKKTEELKQGLMQDLLIEGLSSGSTQEIQIGPQTLQIPDHWDMEPCGQLFEAVNGRGFKPKEWEEEGTQIIRIQDLRPDAEAETNYANFDVDDKYHVTDGDLLFCWAGNINTSLGAYIWSGDDAYLNQHIYNLRPKKELNKRFFAFSLNQHLRLLKTMVGGSAGQVHITKGDFEAFKLPVPPVKEQERIATIIGCAQKKLDGEKNKKEELQELKRGLMQDLLTGKVRVDTD